MSCDKYLDLISACLDDELTEQESSDLSAHLAQCPACRAIAEDMKGLHCALTGLGEVPAPPVLSQSVMTRIAREKGRTRRRFVRHLSGLAACLVLLAGIWQLTGPGFFSGTDPNLPGVARHSDPQPLTLHSSDPEVFSNQQRLRLSSPTASLEPSAQALGSAQELAAFLARFPTDDLSTVYDEAFFRSHRLLAVVLQEPSGSITHTITGVTQEAVTITRQVPAAGDCDMALWLLLAELDGPGAHKTLTVVFTDK